MSFAEYIAGVQTMVHVIVSLLHDRDCIYGAAFRQRVREVGHPREDRNFNGVGCSCRVSRCDGLCQLGSSRPDAEDLRQHSWDGPEESRTKCLGGAEDSMQNSAWRKHTDAAPLFTATINTSPYGR